MSHKMFHLFSEALHLVSTAAAHANDAMMRIEKFKKLLEVQEMGGMMGELVGNKSFFDLSYSRLNHTVITASADRTIR